ncbi:hypothetical protein [Streptomyces flavalbus]|uniref:XRE family transcriptional regulator n=1 Tax=Streptomyces flavalbus TaxID=2665155 RepID=A0ABW2WMM1_9ACTN
MTLERLGTLTAERGIDRSELLDPGELAARTALPLRTVRALLRGEAPPEDTVNERVRARIHALASAHLERTGQRMSDLVGSISRELGVSAYWARQVCSGQKVPSVELLHGLVGFFRVEGGEAFFTAPADEAVNRVLMPVVAALQRTSDRAEASGDPLAAAGLSGYGDVRGVALRKAGRLPPERWKVLNATLEALLELDEREGER